MRQKVSQFWALVPAAGSGTRMGAALPKQYLTVRNKTILEHTLQVLLSYPKIEKIVVVLAAADTHWPKLQAHLPAEKILTVLGAQQRYLSVYQGLIALQAIAQPDDWVLVHDAVRPCLQHVDLDRLIMEVGEHAVGGLLGVPVVDTLKRCDKSGAVVETVSRVDMWQAQSPQMFRLNILTRALQQVIARQLPVTDDASAVELLGKPVLMVAGQRSNIKVTTAEDLLMVRQLMNNHGKMQCE